MKTKKYFVIKSGAKIVNNFMRQADLWREGEGACTTEKVTVTWKEGEVVDDKRMAKAAQTLKEAFEKMGREVFSIHENGIKII